MYNKEHLTALSLKWPKRFRIIKKRTDDDGTQLSTLAIDRPTYLILEKKTRYILACLKHETMRCYQLAIGIQTFINL